MKYLLILFILGCVNVLNANGQTNIYNIYNSQVTILEQAVPGVTKSVPSYQSKKVVIPQYYIERLRWENMLEERRKASFKWYLKRYYR